MYESTLVSIEMINGKKWIHYSGYGYEVDYFSEKPARWVDYTWLMCPLSVALDYGISEWEYDNQDTVHQYIEDLTFDDLDEIYENPDYIWIKESQITMDTPCGFYFIIGNEERYHE